MRTVPAVTTRAFIPRSRSSRPTPLLTSFTASEPNRVVNFAQPVCGTVVTSMTASRPQAASRREGWRRSDRGRYRAGHRELPAVAAPRDELRQAGVHQRELGVVRRRRPQVPSVADETDLGVQLALGEDLALVLGRPADDQLQCPALGRGRANVVEARGELLGVACSIAGS